MLSAIEMAGRGMDACLRAMAVALLAAAMLAATPAPSMAAQLGASVSAKTDNGFARLTFIFDDPLEHEATIANGVLVVSLSSEIEIDLSNLVASVPGYIAAARLDPDRATLRFALAQRLGVNSIAARDRLYVDLLPQSWVGPPPGLPEEVIAELIRQAEEDALRHSRGEADTGRDPLTVRVGRYPTFSRIAFEWIEPTNSILSREGDTLTLTFARSANIELGYLNADLPPQLKSVEATNTDDGLVVKFAVQTGADVRGFREGNTYVVDLVVEGDVDGVAEPATLEEAQSAGTLAAISTAQGQMLLPGASADPDPSADASGQDLVSISVTPLELGGEEIGAEMSEEIDLDDREAERDSPGTPAGVDDELPDPIVVETSDAAAAAEAQPQSASEMDPNAPVVAEAKLVGTTLRLAFPFAEPVASAAFQRARTLWLVFDSPARLDIGAVKREAGGMVRESKLIGTGDVQVLRLVLNGDYLASATVDRNSWMITVGDLLLAPTAPVTLERSRRSDGLPKVSVKLADTGRVHWLADGAIGDELAVVTAFGPPRGQIKRQEFVEFTALETAHGLAIRPHSDDLAVRIAGEEVVVTRSRGLTLSAGQWPKFVPGSETAVSATRPAFVDFVEWRGDPKEMMRRKAQLFLGEIARAEPAGRINARLKLARLLIAYDLGIEALGIMKVAVQENAEVSSDPAFRAMRGIASAMAGRFGDAWTDLSSHDLGEDPHAALWRSIVAASTGEWRASLLAYDEGQAALSAYRPEHQARFRLAAARAGLETGELDVAARNLEEIDGELLNGRLMAEHALLAARLTEAFGRDDEAMAAYSDLARSRVRPVVAESEMRRVALFLRDGRMTQDAAIKALEGVGAMWRGDNIELEGLRRLAELYAKASRFRDALVTMKVAVVNHPSSNMTRLIADDMSSLFSRLFLDGEADTMEPIAALGLYYDFRELTPIGRHGDEMIRKLAHRLVEVDLLDQAAGLLDHQVSNRLSGAARAQVAADLALIQLMANRPEMALNAIRQTRQSVLPKSLQQRRNLLEARALADLGRSELAMEILDAMSGEDVERTKGEALWHGKQWQSAAEQLERLLGSRWQNSDALVDQERRDVLRAAIGYALAEDTLGLERLRRKYLSKMASSPDASSFDLVTASINRDNIAIATLASEIASIESLQSFLTEFRQRGDSAGSSGRSPAPPGAGASNAGS